MIYTPGILDELQRRDFATFLKGAFKELTGETLVWNWHLDAMCASMVSVEDGRSTRYIINVPPRYLKSICCSVAFVAFLLGRNPSIKVICVSYSVDLAKKFSNDTRKLMRSEWYRRLFQKTRINPRKDTETEFETTAGGGRFATSVGGTLTGRGGDIIIIDDPMKADDASSKAERDRVGDWFSGTLLSRLNDKVNGAILLVMQRVHVDDLAGRLLLPRDHDWEQLFLQGIADAPANISLGDGKFRRRVLGEALHPEREPLHILEQHRKDMGSAAFAAQYQQEPLQPGGNMIKSCWFQRYDRAPDILPTDGIIVSWDTAVSEGTRADYSVGIVMMVRGDQAFILDVVRDRLSFPALRSKVLQLHRRYGTMVADYSLIIEHTSSGMSLAQELRSLGVRPTSMLVDGDKISRMNRPLARIEAGAVWLPRSASWLEEFERELMAFPEGPHDDQVDALSQGLNYVWIRKSRRASSSMLKGTI